MNIFYFKYRIIALSSSSPLLFSVQGSDTGHVLAFYVVSFPPQLVFDFKANIGKCTSFVLTLSSGTASWLFRIDSPSKILCEEIPYSDFLGTDSFLSILFSIFSSLMIQCVQVRLDLKNSIFFFSKSDFKLILNLLCCKIYVLLTACI